MKQLPSFGDEIQGIGHDVPIDGKQFYDRTTKCLAPNYKKPNICVLGF